MFALYKMQARVWFKNPFSYFSFIFATFFLVVLGAISAVQDTTSGASDQQVQLLVQTSFGMAISAMIISSANNFGFTIFNLRDSILLKRIGATKITKTQVISEIVLWGITTLFFVMIWIFFLQWLLGVTGFFGQYSTGENIETDWGRIKWGGLIVAILIGAVVSYTIALFFISISPNTDTYNIITLFYFFFAVFLGGGVTIANTRDWMNIAGKLTPIGWNREFIVSSVSGFDVFNFTSANIVNPPFDSFEKIEGYTSALDFFMPFVFMIIVMPFTVKAFKWDQ
ncbi:MAG: hypothetical protein HPPSJP_4470 [Candidatus Hepatoplasma scabrum]|nr:MAG: hypothetical protein HPPSJP_4470 [Candidatus Hepatoplasma sp.]